MYIFRSPWQQNSPEMQHSWCIVPQCCNHADPTSWCQFLIAPVVIKHCIKQIFTAGNEFNLPHYGIVPGISVWRPVLASSASILGLCCLYEMFNELIARPLLALVSNLITSTLFGIKFNISGKSEKWLASLTTNCRGIQLSWNWAHPCLGF